MRHYADEAQKAETVPSYRPKRYCSYMRAHLKTNFLFQTFFDLNFSEYSLIFNKFRNSSIPGPPSWGSWDLLTFLWGALHPPHLPLVPALLVPSCVRHVRRPPINLLDYCKLLLDYCIWIVIVVHTSLIIMLLLKLLYLILSLIFLLYHEK
jgi:hypothetical protein